MHPDSHFYQRELSVNLIRRSNSSAASSHSPSFAADRLMVFLYLSFENATGSRESAARLGRSAARRGGS